MRETKFRAWDRENQRMFEVARLEWRDDGLWAVTPLDKHQSATGMRVGTACDLIEFTGLKDKNGKEIYEGDIVKVTPAFPDGDIKAVHWNDSIQGFAYGGYALPQITFYKFFEVIGNIYENKGLLK